MTPAVASSAGDHPSTPSAQPVSYLASATQVLRGDPFGLDHLEQHARELGARFSSAGPARSANHEFKRRFQENARILRDAHAHTCRAIRAGEPMTPAAEWLLDNFHIVEEQLREIVDDLPERYYRELPKLPTGEPRVYGLAIELLAHTDSALDEETIVRVVRAFQESSPLSIGESWAFPIMLRLGLVENLRRLAEQMLARSYCRRQACELLDRWTQESDICFEVDSSDRCRALVLHLVEELQKRGELSAAGLKVLERQLARRQMTIDDTIRGEHQHQAANQVTIGNVITSMRLISSLDWVQFFERTNLAEAILRRDPAGVYSRMDFASRDRYRHVIEQLAKGSKLTDRQVAAEVLQLASQSGRAGPEAALESHIGYFLIDAGRPQLESRCGYRPALRKRITQTMVRHPHLTFLGGIGVATSLWSVAVILGAAHPGMSWWFGLTILLLSLIPGSELAVSFVNQLVSALLLPRLIPKLELRDGVPTSGATFVVIPSMLISQKEIDSLAERLELHYLANPESELRFALLTDFRDASQQHLPDDDKLVAYAKETIRKLNDQYQSAGRAPFYLFHRERRWNVAENCWMGWERKRGKLTEFNHLLRGNDVTSYVAQEGDLGSFRNDRRNIRFVITLDADTQLPYGAARRMIGALMHPLNQPQVNAAGGCLTRGYSLLQPRLTVHLASANRSRFSRIYSNSPGIDPYATAASDVYQDLYGEGSFTGKGIYDVDSFEGALSGAFPDNHILSHDLIEGCHARVGLISDVELFDGYPARYDSEMQRAHRWVRGDWQLFPWLLSRVPSTDGNWRRNRLSLLSRWKVFDNLRRSLTAPALLAFLVAGGLAGGRVTIAVSLASLAVVMFPLVAQFVMSFRGATLEKLLVNVRACVTNDLPRTLAQCTLTVVFLPHRAWVMMDAIVRTLWRVYFSRKRLLEWETAAAAEHRLSQQAHWRLSPIWFAPVIAVVLAAVMPWSGLAVAFPWLVGWLLAPAIAHWLNQPFVQQQRAISDAQERQLRRVARRTWSFFEMFVAAEDNWLPPDNFQEYPGEKIAARISPTNEGLFLVSALVARDFGYLSLHDLTRLLEKNLATWSRFDRLHGHFYNWYDTRTLQALHPRYVSTVDSGNLVASFLTVREGLIGLLSEPVVGRSLWQGVIDTIDDFEELCRSVPPSGARQPMPLVQELLAITAGFRRELPHGLGEWRAALESWSTQARRLVEKLTHLDNEGRLSEAGLAEKGHHLLQNFDGLKQEFADLLPWMSLLESSKPSNSQATPLPSEIPTPAWTQSQDSRHGLWQRVWNELIAAKSLAAIARIGESWSGMLDELSKASGTDSEKAWVAALADARTRSAQAAQKLSDRMRAISDHLESLVQEMDFKFLYNPQRRLFSIGYNIEDEKLDRSHYDMLCSEARLASYLAISKGNVEHRHWFQLGRQMTRTAGQMALLSWGGTMFEYLMPRLFQKTEVDSLLDQSSRAAVARQIEYGRQRDVPWGISESAFGALAANADYHYQSFGVPGLGLKRGLAKDLVISPYSTMLAVEVDPLAACDNLHYLALEGGIGPWGFYDSLDYTEDRVPPGKRCIVVRCYMSHHQGMSLISLGNLLEAERTRSRFHSHALGRAAELLLQEKIPRVISETQPHADEVAERPPLPQEDELVSRRIIGVESPAPRTHVLSNGQYTVMLTHTGGGFSQYQDLAVTRWRPDVTCDPWGQFLYIRSVGTGKVWSAAYQPAQTPPEAYEVLYSIDKADFHRRDGDLESHLEVTVSPENNAEVRQLKLTNHGLTPVEIEITSYCEVVLNRSAADLAHPAFQNLFVQTEYSPAQTAILASRRPRDSREKPMWGMHVFSGNAQAVATVQYESSRGRFLGRNRTVAEPAALDGRLSGFVGMVLDPIFAIRCRIRIGPSESTSVGFTTGVAASREEALALAEQYHDLRGVQRTFELAWAFQQVQLRHLQLSAARAHLYQRLLSSLLYPDPVFRGEESAIIENRLGQSNLWKYGISGDVPLMLVHVTKPDQVPNVQELLLAHEYWRRLGLKIDLAILNDYPGSYIDELNEQLVGALHGLQHSTEGKPAGIFLLRASQMSREDQMLLEAAASVVWHADAGSVGHQLANRPKKLKPLPPPAAAVPGDGSVSALTRPATSSVASVGSTLSKLSEQSRSAEELLLWNGRGGLSRDGREYVIRLKGEETTPMPWSNVIANSRFGCLITESGGGCTWGSNSREYKLTRWSNDPVTDPPGEVLYVRDDQSGQFITPMLPPSGGAVEIRHGQGFSRFRQDSEGLSYEVTVGIAPEEPVKFVVLKLRNPGPVTRQLSVFYYVEWALGVCREQTQLHIATEVDEQSGALLARNSYHPDYPASVAFLQILGNNRIVTGDRAAFLGRNRDVTNPTGLRQRHLNSKVGAGLDPCGVVQTTVVLAPQSEVEVPTLLGVGESREEARELLARYANAGAVGKALAATAEQWNDLLGCLQIKTPVPSLDLLANRWLPYQTLSCRIWGRTAFYQSGGAFGFRDQLQDVLSLIPLAPELARAQLLRAASRQFEEGDVQHWWHPPLGRGTRTRFSDDYLWLVYAACHFVETTGQAEMWDEMVSFLHSPALDEHEEERYELPRVSSEKASFYEHCRRAFKNAFRFGAHGLPLMGCGDWNDGMNKVGQAGKGESVWVGWFLIAIAEKFLPIMNRRGDVSESQRYAEQISSLRQSLEHAAWDGEWYRRAFFDDGTPLGSQSSDECQIDSLAQTWAVIAGGATPRTRQAMESVWQRLILQDQRLALLFVPPFDKGAQDPGYIKGYPPGIRENGGQYTHAATWIVRAFAQLNDPQRALAVCRLLNPLEQAVDPAGVERYQVEPYVVAADIYGVAPHLGRGGWTWYTGSSGWLYRVLIEDILGVRLLGNRMRLQPCFPEDWPEFSITYRRGTTTWNIRVLHEPSAESTTATASVDGLLSQGAEFELVEDGADHDVIIRWTGDRSAKVEVGSTSRAAARSQAIEELSRPE